MCTYNKTFHKSYEQFFINFVLGRQLIFWKPYNRHVSLNTGLYVRLSWVRKGYWNSQLNMVGNSQNFSIIKYIFHCTWFVQFQTNKFKIQGLFKDNLQFSRSKISSVTRLSLTPFWTLNWLKHSAESFVIFHFTLLFLYYFP